MAMNNVGGTPQIHPGLLEQFKRTESAPAHEGTGGKAGSGPLKIGNGEQGGDRAEISADARRLNDLRRTLEGSRQAYAGLPEVRQERLAQVRERLDSGYYHSEEVRQTVAERLGSVLRRLETLID